MTELPVTTLDDIEAHLLRSFYGRPTDGYGAGPAGGLPEDEEDVEPEDRPVVSESSSDEADDEGLQ